MQMDTDLETMMRQRDTVYRDEDFQLYQRFLRGQKLHKDFIDMTALIDAETAKMQEEQ